MSDPKFRYYDKFNESFYFSKESLSKFFSDYEDAEYGGNGVILEQFTGMQDINGVDIYVGDILTFTEFDFLLDADDTSTLVIEFKNGCFIAEYLGYTIEGLLSGFIVDDIANPYGEKTEKAKIIGNIHENPEILESIEAEL